MSPPKMLYKIKNTRRPKTAYTPHKTYLFLLLCLLMALKSLLEIEVSFWISWRFFRVRFCIWEVWPYKLTLISFATSKVAYPTYFASSRCIFCRKSLFVVSLSTLCISKSWVDPPLICPFSYNCCFLRNSLLSLSKVCLYFVMRCLTTSPSRPLAS